MTNAVFLKQSVSWEEDYRDRLNPDLMTGLLHRAVPVLRETRWRVTVVEPGYAETELPLNEATTNQHGTHQAALISLSADYTGGTALATLLRGVPMAGVHRNSAGDAASVWLASMNVRYKVPSTGHLIGRCRIPDHERELIVSRYSEGKKVLVTLPVRFESNGQTVAEAEMTYFARPAIQVLGAESRSSALFTQKIKASARLIAGVRAETLSQRPGRADQCHARIAAGPQGEMLAQRLRRALPQLVRMVQVRTQHGNETIHSVKGLRQVVLAGAGLDMRPFELREELPGVVFFEVDLPEMLAERNRVARQILDSHFAKRVSVPCDFLHDDVESELLARGYDPRLPAAIVYEGCSMYFERRINEKMLRLFASLMQHPASRLWVDFVSESVINGETTIPEVQEFFHCMDDLGESFIFGCDNPAELIAACGLESLGTTTVRKVVESRDGAALDSVLDQYCFDVSRRRWPD